VEGAGYSTGGALGTVGLLYASVALSRARTKNAIAIALLATVANLSILAPIAVALWDVDRLESRMPPSWPRGAAVIGSSFAASRLAADFATFSFWFGLAVGLGLGFLNVVAVWRVGELVWTRIARREDKHAVERALAVMYSGAVIVWLPAASFLAFRFVSLVARVIAR
jgi:hypothetical protein